MGNEIEVKWVLSSSDENIRKKLGYENFSNLKLFALNHNLIITNLEKILLPSIKYTPNIVAIDQFYWPVDNIDSNQIGELEYYTNGLYMNEEKILRLNPNKNNKGEALDLIELITQFYFQNKLEPFKRQLRVRNEIIGSRVSIYLTGKSKNGIGDENNIECEIELAPNQNLDLFFNSIGYYAKEDKKKTKRKTKFSGYYSYKKIPIKTNVEIVKIEELLGLEFLEIEMLPEIKTNNKDLLDVIYSLAKELGVENNRIENRGYQVLQNILVDK